MATINKNVLNREVRKLVFSKDIQNLAYQRAEREFERIKNQTLRDFDQHPVTQELNAGVNGKNITNTLPGARDDANLFSFIGFNEEDKPTEEVRRILEEEITLDKNPKSVILPTGVQFNFNVKIPTLKSIEQKTPLPWETGRSWVRGIERGISGLGYYLSGKFRSPEPSRSGGGIQSDNKVRSGAFSTVKYLSQILNNIKEKLK